MNTAEAQEVKHFLLQSHDQYRELAERHHELDDRLHELTEQALPLRIRASRRSHPEEAQAGPQGPDGADCPRVGARSSFHDILTRPARPSRRRELHGGRRRTGQLSGTSSDAYRPGRLAVRRRWTRRRGPRGRRWPEAHAASPRCVLPAFFLFFFRDPERADRRRARRGGVAGRWPRDGGGRADRELRRRTPGSRSASSCRRWTCTSTGCRWRAA